MLGSGILFVGGKWFVCFRDHQLHRRILQTSARTAIEAARIRAAVQRQELRARKILLKEMSRWSTR